jgi:hypothetical protein
VGTIGRRFSTALGRRTALRLIARRLRALLGPTGRLRVARRVCAWQKRGTLLRDWARNGWSSDVLAGSGRSESLGMLTNDLLCHLENFALTPIGEFAMSFV